MPDKAAHMRRFFRFERADVASPSRPGWYCKICGKWFSGVDVAGRVNWFGMVSHLSKHVGERLRERATGSPIA